MQIVLYGQIFAESELRHAVFCITQRAAIPQFIRATDSERYIYFLYIDDKYNLNVSIWLSTSDLFRHLNLYVSFLS